MNPAHSNKLTAQPGAKMNGINATPQIISAVLVDPFNAAAPHFYGYIVSANGLYYAIYSR